MQTYASMQSLILICGGGREKWNRKHVKVTWFPLEYVFLLNHTVELKPKGGSIQLFVLVGHCFPHVVNLQCINDCNSAQPEVEFHIENVEMIIDWINWLFKFSYNSFSFFFQFLQHVGDFNFPRLADFGAAISGANKLQCQEVLEELDVSISRNIIWWSSFCHLQFSWCLILLVHEISKTKWNSESGIQLTKTSFGIDSF